MMPAFSNITKEEKGAVIAFLFEASSGQGDKGVTDNWETDYEDNEYRDVMAGT